MSAKRPLSKTEVRELINELAGLISFQRSRRHIFPVTSYIKEPQTPGLLGESIAYHLVADGLLFPGFVATDVRLASLPDLLFEVGGQTKRCQVKCARGHDWASRGDHDLDVDAIIWISLGSLFEGLVTPGASVPPASVYLFPNPASFASRMKREKYLRLDDLRAASGIAAPLLEIDPREL